MLTGAWMGGGARMREVCIFSPNKGGDISEYSGGCTHERGLHILSQKGGGISEYSEGSIMCVPIDCELSL